MPPSRVPPQTKAVKLPVPSEHQSQCAFFERVALDHRTRDLPIFAIPNGGKRHVVTAMKMKREGVMAGVPDIFVAVARPPLCNCHGLFIEMKKEGEKRTPVQELWGARLTRREYKVEVCFSADEAWSVLTAYLGIAP